MKTKGYTLFILSLLVIPALLAQKPLQTLEVLYFHATRRCPTCLAIEENTRKTLNTWFADQLKKGTVKLTVVDVDDEKNKALAEKYEATGSALFITKTTTDKESRNDMTDFAFSYARNNPDKFIRGMKDKISALLK